MFLMIRRTPISTLFPYTTLFRSLRRNRRLRTNESIRSLVRETIISPNDFIVPLFVVEGSNVREEIQSMQNYFRLRSEEHTSELQSRLHLVCRLLLEKKNKKTSIT